MALAACKAVINGEARRMLKWAIEAGEEFEDLLAQAQGVDRATREEMTGKAIALDRGLMDGSASLPSVCDGYAKLNLSFAEKIDASRGAA